MLNPDVRVRTVLFDFISTHDFVLTDKGYMVVYKAVYDVKEDGVNTSFAEYISNRYLHVKKHGKKVRRTMWFIKIIMMNFKSLM